MAGSEEKLQGDDSVLLPKTKAENRSRTVTIRFPQIDAAGIVFYPRYFEMVRRLFPDAPVARPPIALKTQFIRPNRLGDVLDIEYAPGDGSWCVTGRMDGHDCFRMSPAPDALSLADDSHRPDVRAFRTKPELLGDWALGRDGKMQLSRSFEYLNVAIEEWIEETLGMPFHEMHVGGRVGIPTVQFDTIVRELPQAGAELSVWIRPTKFGSRSMTISSWLVADGRAVISNEQVVVFVEMLEGGYRSIPIPADMGDAFKRWLVDDEEH